MAQCEIDLLTQDDAQWIFGELDVHLDFLEKELLIRAVGRGSTLLLTGDEDRIAVAERTIRAMQDYLKEHGQLDEQAVRYAVNLALTGEDENLRSLSGPVILLTDKRKPIKPKTLGQKTYIEKIEENTIVFGVGPAGTGKTYLAVAMAVRALKRHEVGRIILTRPAVEAGEKLGFLPGDLQEKVDPYLRPLYDALFDMLGADGFQKHLEKSVIEVAPLAYMRGRTLDDAFIILDEAQNTTPEQMKMFLTRLGNGSKMVVNGDITQIDLSRGKRSGLIEATRILRGIEGIAEVRFSDRDVVRFRLVAEIVKAYEKAAKRREDKKVHRSNI